MTDPIEERLRAALAVRAEQAEVSADAWARISERTGRMRARQRLQRVAAVAGVALVAIVGISVPFLLDAARSDDPDVQLTQAAPDPSPTAVPTAEPTAPPAPTTSPTPAPSPDEAGSLDLAPGMWMRVDDEGAFAPGKYVDVEDVAANGSTVVAVGSFTVDGARGQPTRTGIWRAEGGAAWSHVALDDAVFGGAPNTYTSALAVTATRDGFLAAGESTALDTASQPVAWTSPDGRTWRRLELPGQGIVRALATVDGAIVAVGETPGRGPAAWASQDGITWEHVVLPSLGPEGVLRHVTVHGDRVVALGESSVALSDDRGRSWTQTALGDAGFDPAVSAIEDVLSLPDGTLLTVVARGDFGLASYVSIDGATWEPIGALPPEPRDGLQRVSGLLARSDGNVVAVGLATDVAAMEAAVWISADGGATWERVQPGDRAFAGGQMTALIEVGEQLVAVGRDESGQTPVGAVWVTAP